MSPPSIDIDDEAVSSLLRYHLLPGVIDAVHWDASDLRLDLVKSAEVHHILCLLNASCIRSRDRVSVQHKTHLADLIGIHDLTDPDSAVHGISLQERDEAVQIMGRSQLRREFTDEERAQLVAFLESLTGEFPQVPYPALPRRYSVGAATADTLQSQ